MLVHILANKMRNRLYFDQVVYVLAYIRMLAYFLSLSLFLSIYMCGFMLNLKEEPKDVDWYS